MREPQRLPFIVCEEQGVQHGEVDSVCVLPILRDQHISDIEPPGHRSDWGLLLELDFDHIDGLQLVLFRSRDRRAVRIRGCRRDDFDGCNLGWYWCLHNVTSTKPKSVGELQIARVDHTCRPAVKHQGDRAKITRIHATLEEPRYGEP